MLFDFRTAVLSGLLDGGFVRLVCRLGRRNQTKSASNSCHDYLKHPSLPLLASVSAHSFTTQYDSDATWPVCRLREEPPQRSLRGAQSLRRRLEVLCRALHFSLVLLRRNSESGKLLLLRVLPPGSTLNPWPRRTPGLFCGHCFNRRPQRGSPSPAGRVQLAAHPRSRVHCALTAKRPAPKTKAARRWGPRSAARKSCSAQGAGWMTVSRHSFWETRPSTATTPARSGINDRAG
jgi:hypothetical protein